MIKKLLKNCQNCYDEERCMVLKLSKILFPNGNSTNGRLESRLCQNFTSLSLIFLDKKLKSKQSKSVTKGQRGLGRVGYFFLYDSISPEIIITIYLNFFPIFLKVSQLFECRRGDLYMAANKNFIRFAHS